MKTQPLRCGAAALIAVVVLMGGPGTSAQRPGGSSFVLRNVRVFDGDRVHENTQVAVEEGIIRAVGRNLTGWRHLPAIDGVGGTLMPGLIDAHAHVHTVDDLRQALRFGVTTVLDMGAAVVPQSQVFDVRSLARAATDIADLRSAGFLASARRPEGSTRPTVSTVEEARRFVALRHAEGADYLKLQLNGVRSATQGEPSLDPPTARALVEAAHGANMLAVAHVETLDDVAVALSAGVDGLAHVWRRGGANRQLARGLSERGVFVIATLAIPDALLSGRTSLMADPRLQRLLSDSLKEHLTRSFTPRTTGADVAERIASLEVHVAGVRSLYDAGVMLVAGTDASPCCVATPAAHGISLHRELELLTGAGLRPIDALRAATLNAAEAFRLADRGRIEAGRRADLVLVRGNPLRDITATRDILRVWRTGIEFDRSSER